MFRLALVCLVLARTGCATSLHPIEAPPEEPDAAKNDTRILGNWSGMHQDQKISFLIAENDGRLLMSMAAEGNTGFTTIEVQLVRTARIGDSYFASTRDVADAKQWWTLYRYRWLGSDTVIVNWPNSEFLIAAVKDKRIKAGLDRKSKRPYLKAKPAELRAFVLANAEQMFAGDGVEMRRQPD